MVRTRRCSDEVASARQATSWRFYGAIHGIDRSLWKQLGYLSSSDPLPSSANIKRFWQQCQHGSWYFLPWHRGYAASWMVAGAVLLSLAFAVRLTAPASWLPLTAAAMLALVWQISPAKQICLNRCHVRPELAAFGPAADLDAIHFGATHGALAGSVWAYRRHGRGRAVAFRRASRPADDSALELARPGQGHPHCGCANGDATAAQLEQFQESA
ncbi:DUF2182 domain-containing protein [Mesorhizobium sp. IMUNJ 23033]|uniref:copper chaperone n=1 Tax=Mesorhizobium sp. IMUNJ 23033 TaxID=3378039 RepID=UPI00384EAA69